MFFMSHHVDAATGTRENDSAPCGSVKAVLGKGQTRHFLTQLVKGTVPRKSV
jgi:hypothetical protein